MSLHILCALRLVSVDLRNLGQLIQPFNWLAVRPGHLVAAYELRGVRDSANNRGNEGIKRIWDESTGPERVLNYVV